MQLHTQLFGHWLQRKVLTRAGSQFQQKNDQVSSIIRTFYFLYMLPNKCVLFQF